VLWVLGGSGGGVGGGRAGGGGSFLVDWVTTNPIVSAVGGGWRGGFSGCGVFGGGGSPTLPQFSIQRPQSIRGPFDRLPKNVPARGPLISFSVLKGNPI